uniref:putative reverse transcriptase/maturase n=1 Tax=Goniotrichopsis reniformis TaxID=468933 RepID=UPI001FCD243A|nr:putative reverse transcriptase/maturase [Goniotrichopsis reniformis]UNJ14860.1 putative reverse transcriptase/maturase [Goniotrichopsis reniformis]
MKESYEMTTSSSNYVENWANIPWEQFEKILFRIQHRIYKAAKNKDYSRIYRLQILLIGSSCARYLAIREIMNRKRFFILHYKSLKDIEKFSLVEELKHISTWKYKKINHSLLKKQNSNTENSVGFAILKDKAIQCLIKYALDPIYTWNLASEKDYSKNNETFWKIQKQILINLKSPIPEYSRYILQIQLHETFDQIEYNKFLSRIVLPDNIKKLLYLALRAGLIQKQDYFLENNNSLDILSSYLCEINMLGIENIGNEFKSFSTFSNNPNYLLRGIRHTYNLIFFLKPHENIIQQQQNIQDFLISRGLHGEKINLQLIKSTEGFDFLGWHFKVNPKTNKCMSYPSKTNRRHMIDSIKRTMKDSRYPLEDRLEAVQLIYLNWRTYHRYSDLSQINVWSIKLWTYKFAKKLNAKKNREARAIGKEKLILKIREIFNHKPYSFSSS